MSCSPVQLHVYRIMMKTMTSKDFFILLRDAFKHLNKDKGSRLAAALAYYTILSLSPILIIIVGVIGIFLGEKAAIGTLSYNLTNFMGIQTARTIESIIQKSNSPASNGPAAIVGLLLLIVGAIGVLSQLKDALDTIWNIPPHKGDIPFLHATKNKLGSMIFTFFVGIILVIAVLLSTIISGIARFLDELGYSTYGNIEIVNVITTILILTGLFTLIYKLLPSIRIAWSDVFLGAFLTSILFTVGRLAIGTYLSITSFGSVYGAASSLVILLVWIYYSAQIFLYGAEITKVYTHRFGSKKDNH